MVPASLFVREMKQHWKEVLLNVSNKALEDTWQQLAEAFIEHVSAHDDPDQREIWTVLGHPTGTGKTQGTILYCAMLSGLLKSSPQDHPGVLIVTKLIEEVNDIAAQINKYSEKYAPGIVDAGPVALAYHSDNKKDHPAVTLRSYPVLVTTHRAFELALGNISSIPSNPIAWKNLHAFVEGERKLIVIDEAINLIEEAQLNGDETRMLLGLIPGPLQKEYPSAVGVLEYLKSYFDYIDKWFARRKEVKPFHDMISSGRSLLDTNKKATLAAPDFYGLSKALQRIPSVNTAWKDLVESPQGDQKLRRGIDELIKAADAIWRVAWRVNTMMEGKFTINTARLLVPDGLKGAVVLDATAGETVFYDIFKKAKLLPPIVGARRYNNVSLHVSTGHSVGKISMKENSSELCTQLVADLATWAKGHSVLVITHKGVKDSLETKARKLKEKDGYKVTVTYWGVERGSNEWKTYDTIVIFGLQYRPPNTWPINNFIACQGPKPNSWLSEAGERGFGRHQDIKEALLRGQLVTDVIQGINRIRCRNVIDAQGNCPQADVHILLPGGSRGETILERIQKAMPGIQVSDWEYTGKKPQPRKGKHDDSLVAVLRDAKEGRILVSKVRDMTEIPGATFDRMIARVRENDLEDTLVQAVANAGFSYEVKREGSTYRAYFLGRT